MRVALHTLGCRVNHGETEGMAKLLSQAKAEIVPFSREADVYIINTCTVTAVAAQKSRQMLSRAKRQNPSARIIAVGCLANTDGGGLIDAGLADLCLAPGERTRIVQHVFALLGAYTPPMGESPQDEWALPVFEGNRVRADLKVQDGCNRLCSYCVIPLARGLPRSRPLDDCRNAMLALARRGIKELTLTGIQLAAWGENLPDKPDLTALIKAAGEIADLPRLRLGSVEPQIITPAFADACAQSPNLCPQFHVSLQSGSDGILRRMNRRYTVEEYAAAVHMLREAMPLCAVSTDIIAGFPGESLAEHTETLAFIRKLGFSRVHAFPFSPRKGTAADAMAGKLPRAEIERRTREIIALGDTLAAEFAAAQVGRDVRVLVEGDGEGYTENYVRARVAGDCPTGTIVAGRVTAAKGATLIVNGAGIESKSPLSGSCFLCYTNGGDSVY